MPEARNQGSSCQHTTKAPHARSLTSRLLLPWTLHSDSDNITTLKKCQSTRNLNTMSKIKKTLNKTESPEAFASN